MERTSSTTSKRQMSGKSAPIASISDAWVVSQSYSAIPLDEQERHGNEKHEYTVSPFSQYRSMQHLIGADHNDTNIVRMSESTKIDTTVLGNVISTNSAEASGSAFVQEKLRSRNCWQHTRTTIGKFWLWEIAACVLSLVCLASIVSVLIYEDGRQLDQWEWMIPPTVVVSFIGTLGKSAMVLVISQVLSQLKWFHFQDTRSLEHVKTFDYASRGPVGSIMIIWSSRRWLASIAACLMIMTLLVDPFVQLVFSFPTDLVEDKSQQATFNMTSYYMDNSTSAFAAFWTSVNQGFVSSNLTQAVICPSGNCTWDDPVKTLGVCGSCSDVTPTVKVNCTNWSPENDTPTCTYTFSTGTVLTATGVSNLFHKGPMQLLTLWNSSSHDFVGETDISLPFDYSLDPNKPLIGNAQIWNGTIITFEAIQLDPLKDNIPGEALPVARCSSCELYWCEWTYNGLNVVNSKPITTTYIAKERLWYASNRFVGKGSPFVEAGRRNYLFLPSEVETLRNSTLRPQYGMLDSITPYLTNFFDAFFLDILDVGSTVDPSEFPGATNLENFPVTLDSLVFSRDINATINKLADSLTESIRTGDNSTSIVGRTLLLKSFIRVRWGWLALPLTIMILTCILLIIVAIKSHLQYVTVWKDDPLALLFHRVEGVDVLPGSDSRSGPTDLQKMVEEIYVKLDENVPLTFIVSGKKAKHTSRWWRKG